MRFEKLTTKFQQAFADAQSLAIGHDSAFIEPQHLTLSLLQQDDGGTVSLLQRSGANIAPLRDALKQSIENLPKMREAISARPRIGICSSRAKRDISLDDNLFSCVIYN